MTTKTLDTRLQQYWQLLEQDEKKSMLTFMKSFLKNRAEPHGQRISIEQYNRELDEAEAEIDSGHFITHEEVKKLVRSW